MRSARVRRADRSRAARVPPGASSCGAPGPSKNASASSRLERIRVPHSPPAERDAPAEPRVRPRVADAERSPFPGWTSPISVTVTRPRRVEEPIPAARGEHDAAHRSGPPHGRAQRDRPAERVADPHGAADPLRLGHREDASAKSSRCAASGSASDCPCPGRSGTRTRCVPRERGRDAAPVLDRPAEAVHEHDRRPVATDRVTKPRAVHDELAIVELLRRCLRSVTIRAYSFASGFEERQ